MKRFLTLAEVAETLSISMPQAYALVRGGDLPAIQIGGRNQWRVEAAKLEEFIDQAYARRRDAFDDSGAERSRDASVRDSAGT